MNRTFGKLLLASLAAFVGLNGCIQFGHSTTLFPDGSGKVTMQVGFKKSMIKMMEEMGKSMGAEEKMDPLSEFTDPAKLKETGEGIVAWTAPKRDEDNDWIKLSFTGYFEDINQVKIYNKNPQPGAEAERKVAFDFKYERTSGGGGTLTMNNGATEDLSKMAPGGEEGQNNPEMAKAMLEMMKPMLEGMKVSFTVKVPGPVQEAGGLEKKDNTASFSIDGDTMIAAMGNPEGPEAKKLKEMSASKEGKVTWKETTVSSAETAAFKKELSEAKEAWQKMLDEAKKKEPKKEE